MWSPAIVLSLVSKLNQMQWIHEEKINYVACIKLGEVLQVFLKNRYNFDVNRYH